jgi:alpha-tubulin suppressor-like RCC1 family protein
LDYQNCHACNKACLFACGRDDCDEVTAISAGLHHVCAVTREGVLACWGWNASGQIGDGSTKPAEQPVRVSGLGVVHRAVAGYGHTCAIAGANRELYCWGAGAAGQLGDASLVDHADPAKVTDANEASGYLSAVTDISLGSAHTCAVHGGGKVSCWGDSSLGRLGNSADLAETSVVATATPAYRASDFAPLADAEQIVSGQKHTCVLFTDHTVACWGDDASAQIGGPRPAAAAATPVSGLSGVQRLCAGPSHTCAVTQEGIACWGNNSAGQLGRPGTAADATPTLVSGVSDVIDCSAGSDYTCALTRSGIAQCWGTNTYGERGNAPEGFMPAPLSLAGLKVIAAGGGFGCALDTNSQLWCWGVNDYGELGLGTGTITSAPQPTPSKVVSPDFAQERE